MSKAKTHRAKSETQGSIPDSDTLLDPQSKSDPDCSTPMELAFAEWQHARAALNLLDIEPALREKPLAEAMERADACEWKIIRTRVKTLFDIRLRAMALHQVFLDAEMAGEPTDHRHQMMLAALIYDVFDARVEWRAQ
jgi:hypothetical protein